MSDIYIHPQAIVETQQIGAGTRVWAFTHIMQGASIGANSNIGEHCFIESRVSIGKNVTIKNGNMVWDGVSIADGVFVGPNVSFTNDLHPRSPRLPQARTRYTDQGWLVPTLVKQGASLGAGAVIVAGVVIGEFAMVGAGAVVTHDVPPYALVVGNPARIRGWVCQCGQSIDWQADVIACDYCGLRFARAGGSFSVEDTGVSVVPLELSPEHSPR